MKKLDLNTIKIDFSNPKFDINEVIDRVNDFFKSTGEIEALFDESKILLFILKEYIEFQEKEIDMIRKAFKEKENAESSRNEETIKRQIQETMPSHIDKELAYKYGRCLECDKWYGDCNGH